MNDVGFNRYVYLHRMLLTAHTLCIIESNQEVQGQLYWQMVSSKFTDGVHIKLNFITCTLWFKLVKESDRL
jgi:hypothetical protein